MKHPFAAPTRLAPELARVEAYWRERLRGSAEIPFWDDIRLEDLPDLKPHLMLIETFSRPERFRFAIVGSGLGETPLDGCFLDETELGSPFEFLRSQCSATIEAAAATFYLAPEQPGSAHYSRLLLPLWGDGRISMILGAVAVP